MAKWLLVDGYNLAYRCFFAVPELSRADGFPTNALHGWVKSLWRLSDQEKPDGVLVFFDLGGAQDRLALLPEYKAQRDEMPEPLARQVPVIKALTRAMGLGGVEQDGVESDDLLASHAVALSRRGDEVVIVSSDKDFAPVGQPQAGLAADGRGGSHREVRRSPLKDRRLPRACRRCLGQHPGPCRGGAEDRRQMACRIREPGGGARRGGADRARAVSRRRGVVRRHAPQEPQGHDAQPVAAAAVRGVRERPPRRTLRHP